MKPRSALAGAALMLCALAAQAEAQRQPHIGYAYPAGGCQGTTVRVTVGGEFLGGVTNAYVSGDGVRATVIKHYRQLRNLDKEQREELLARFAAVRDKRLKEMGIDPSQYSGEFMRNRLGVGKQSEKLSSATTNSSRSTTNAVKRAGPVEHPLLENIEDKSLRELQHVASELLNMRMRQPNAQIGELVVVELAISSNAAPGERNLRLRTPLGLTNPIRLQIGQWPEVTELEPNQPNELPALSPLKPDPPFDLPIVINGQITPGDVDLFKFKARKGQNLLVEVQARALIPYLADTVPGWFQTAIAIRDARSNVVAHADDYRFNPDPLIFWTVPETGVYEIEIRDTLYRGRDDFVYRLLIGEHAYITILFPLGGQTGVPTVATASGWNLPVTRVPFDTMSGITGLRRTTWRKDRHTSNPVAYMVGTLPECLETEPNNTPTNAQYVVPPLVVNGHIGRAGDVDVFSFNGTSGETIVAEVYARRLDSPLDSLLRLTDASGNVLAMNDDCEDKEMGLLTHHADSYLRATLPANGMYYVWLSDAQQHGGPAYGYRLRIGQPQPDFALRATPSSINVPAGRASPLCVHVVRKDGFTGDVEIVLVDAPRGFELDGCVIPASRDRVRMTLTASAQPLNQPACIHLVGRAIIGGERVVRPVTPAEDLMQAFAYRHLAPSQDMMVWTIGGKFAKFNPPRISLTQSEPIRLSQCGATTVFINAARRPMMDQVKFELSEPPAGITLTNVSVTPVGVSLVFNNDGKTNMVGYTDNLIVEAYMDRQDKGQLGKRADQNQRIPLGVLPAIPFVIVPR